MFASAMLLLLVSFVPLGDCASDAYENQWELPVLYQDCDRTDPCCWRTYAWLLQQHNSLIITWVYDQGPNQNTDLDYCIDQCNAKSGCNAFWHYQDSRVFLINTPSQFWYGRRFCYLARAGCRPETAWPYEPDTNDHGEVHDITASLYVRKREDIMAEVKLEFKDITSKGYNLFPERICSDIFDAKSQHSIELIGNFFDGTLLDKLRGEKNLDDEMTGTYKSGWSTHGEHYDCDLEECENYCESRQRTKQKCGGFQYIGSIHRELDDETGICYIYGDWSCPVASMATFHGAHYFERTRNSGLEGSAALGDFQRSQGGPEVELSYAPPMTSRRCTKGLKLVGEFLRSGEKTCLKECNKNDTCQGVFVERDDKIAVGNLKCYHHMEICTIQDRRYWSVTKSKGDRTYWRYPPGAVNFTLYEGKACLEWRKGQIFPWGESDYNLIYAVNSTDFVQCAEACRNNTICQSFEFAQFERRYEQSTCRLYQKVCNPYFFATVRGYNYYIKKPPEMHYNTTGKKNKLFSQKYIFDRMGCDSATGHKGIGKDHHMWDSGGNLIPDSDKFHFFQNSYIMDRITDTSEWDPLVGEDTGDHLRTISVTQNEECADACEKDTANCTSFYVYRTYVQRMTMAPNKTCRLVASVCTDDEMRYTGFEYYATDQLGLADKYNFSFPYSTRKILPTMVTPTTRAWHPRRRFLKLFTTKRPLWHPDRLDDFFRMLRVKPSPMPKRPDHPPPTVRSQAGHSDFTRILWFITGETIWHSFLA